jgi:cobalt-zinc-cadmium efflux system membrane fusion protein
MSVRNILATVAIIAAIAAAALVVLREPPMEQDAGGHGHGHGGDDHADDFERGEHGGRLLMSDNLELEVTIFEDGIPPQFRVYPSKGNEPVSLANVSLTIELSRFGGRMDTIEFVPEGEYLRGVQVVEEPHSFDVSVRASYEGEVSEWSFESHEGRVELTSDAAEYAGIELGVAGPASIDQVLSLPGEITLNPDRIVHVVPRLRGVVRSVEKPLGANVAEDELLAVIDSGELADTKSSYLEAVEHYRLAESKNRREKQLFDEKISAQQDYFAAVEAMAKARIEMDSFRHKLLSLEIDVDDVESDSKDRPLTEYEIRSPIDGVIIEKHIARGEALTPDADIFVLADLSNVWAEVVVYARDLARVREGARVTIHSDDLGKETEGVVSYIGQLVGEETRSARAIVEILNESRDWRPGLYVTVDVIEDVAEVPVAVPVAAIQTFRDWQVVYGKHMDTYEIKPVELGRSDGKWIEVVSGLEPGDEYVVKNSFVLKAELGKASASHAH